MSTKGSIKPKLLHVRDEVGCYPFLAASAPSRADLLNTHQDYKGLPVVPIALSLRAYAFAVRQLKDEFRMVSLNLKREGLQYLDVFSADRIELKRGGWFGDYFRSVALSLQQACGRGFDRGLEVVIDSDVPVGGGLGSSAALEVAIAKLLNEFFHLGLSPIELAEACFIAENRILGIPCGRLDQYGSALGGAILLYPRDPPRVVPLPLSDINIVVVDSGIRHSVADIHPLRQEEIDRGLHQLMEIAVVPGRLKQKLGHSYAEPSWDAISVEEIKPYLSLIDQTSAKRLLYTVKANDSTRRAIDLIRRGTTRETLYMLGEIVNEQHELLRDLYDVSLPGLEAIRNAMLKAGALGVKLSGAGLGGCLLGLVEDVSAADDVLRAALEAGATKGWILRVDEGARLEGQGWPETTS